MSTDEVKGVLHDYLRGAREVLLWKLDGLGEYDLRRPLTPTGTNLLGLVKHNAWELALYFGSEVFGRESDFALPWMSESAEPNSDMWARADETTEEIVSLYRQTWVLADATIEELPLDAEAHVWWWGDDPVPLHRILVHVTANTQRHAGHADIIRESIDGAVGLLPGHDNMRLDDREARERLRTRIEEAAQAAAKL